MGTVIVTVLLAGLAIAVGYGAAEVGLVLGERRRRRWELARVERLARER